MSGVIADVVRLAAAVSGVAVALRGDAGNAVRFMLVFALLLGVRALDLPTVIDAAFGAALVVEGWANAQGWYEAWDLLDRLLHFGLGGLAGGVAYVALARFSLLPDPAERIRRGARVSVVLLTVTSSATVGVLWELYEWAATNLWPSTSIHVGYDDTVLDLAMDLAGASVVGVILLLRLRRDIRTSQGSSGHALRRTGDG